MTKNKGDIMGSYDYQVVARYNGEEREVGWYTTFDEADSICSACVYARDCLAEWGLAGDHVEFVILDDKGEVVDEERI